MPLPDITFIKQYNTIYSLLDVRVEFHCPACDKLWQSPEMNYSFGDVGRLPVPFKCSCNNKTLLLMFDGLEEKVKEHYDAGKI